jgi:hypothetical protein
MNSLGYVRMAIIIATLIATLKAELNVDLIVAVARKHFRPLCCERCVSKIGCDMPPAVLESKSTQYSVRTQYSVPVKTGAELS